MAANDWMRAADRDREETADILRGAYAEGRLDRAELDERTDAALRAQTWGELRRLITDIPPPSPDSGLPPDSARGPGPPLSPGQPRSWHPAYPGILILLAAITCVVIGAAARSIAVIAVAVLAASAVAIRRR